MQRIVRTRTFVARLRRARRAAVCAACLVGLLGAVANAAADEPHKFNIPAQDLASALRAFGAASDEQVLFSNALVSGLHSSELIGKYTVDVALDILLKGSGLHAERTPAGVLLIRASKPDTTSSTPEISRAEALALELTEVVVTGSHIRRSADEVGIAPVTVYDRAEIERSGALNMESFVGRMTQSAPDANQQTPNFTNPTAGRTTANLHGLGSGATLVLLNGRRLSRTGQGIGFDAVDLSSIPLAATERVEVLSTGASAIYGADAIGGVFNVITRKNYDGLSFSTQYGNTTDTDVGERNFQLTGGHAGTLGGKHYNVMFSGEAYLRNALAARDRPYTASTDYSSSGGINLTPLTLNTVPLLFRRNIGGGAGTVYTLNGPSGVPLPGNTSAVDAIPANQNGIGLTRAAFQSDSTPLTNALAEAPLYTTLLPSEQRYSGLLSAELDLSAGFNLFADGYFSTMRAVIEGAPAYASTGITNNVLVPAGNPFNPFGQPVYVSKAFDELGPTRIDQEVRSEHVTLGLRGDVSSWSDWEYEFAATGDRSVLDREGDPFAISFAAGTPAAAAINSTDPNTALNVFADGRSDPDARTVALLRSLLGRQTYEETSEILAYEYKMDGPIATLPAGQVKMAIGAEYREELAEFNQFSPAARVTSLTNDNTPQRHASAAYIETDVPLISRTQQVPLVHELRMSAAGRFDQDSIFDKGVFSPELGLLWRPVADLAIRGSYGEGYKVPNLNALYSPVANQTVTSTPPLVDPVTGASVGTYNATTGGNVDLQPEESRSFSAGFIVEPRALSGFSASFDYGHIDYIHKAITPLAQTVLDSIPDRVTRDPVTNAITALDLRALNLDSVRAEFIDSKWMYQLDLRSAGRLNLQINGTYNLSFEQNASGKSTQLVDNYAGYPRLRTVGQVFWSRHGLTIGTTANYTASTVNSLTPTASRPKRIESSCIFDLQASYDFGGRWSPITRGANVRIGALNVFNSVPPSTNGDGGYYRIDPRQRVVYVALKKDF
jgi:outer membrane receptor protein involved in Fe transport